MKKWVPFLCSLSVLSQLYSAGDLQEIANAGGNEKSEQTTARSSHFQGWSFDLGGQYTWMKFTSPNLPTFSGSTGGVHGRITYQKQDSLFAQVRSFWNAGHLTMTGRSSNDKEFYTDLLGGYCFSVGQSWMITPYLGLGFDFLREHQSSTHFVTPIGLTYRLNYGLAGVDVRYFYGEDWVFGGQVDCFPTFEQHLSITGMKGVAWKLKQRVGCNVRATVDYRLPKNFWLEASPYYRLVSIGESHVLSLPHRNLNEFGLLITFRYFL